MLNEVESEIIICILNSLYPQHKTKRIAELSLEATKNV